MTRQPLLIAVCSACAALLVACGSVASRDYAGAGAGATASPSQPSVTPTPVAAATANVAPATRGIPSRSQSLRVSGVASGAVTNAEVKTCGANGGLWVIQLSNLGLDGATASFSLTVQPYGGPATYQPKGSLMLIANQRASFYTVSSGSVTITDPKTGSMDVTFTTAGAGVRIAGGWAC